MHLLKNTIHRGIKNQADYDRPMFFIYLTPDKDFMIKESVVASDIPIPKREK